MPIRTLPSRAIADASIQAVDIASNSISKAKIDADTRLGLQNDSIILDGTDGAGANKGDFLVLDGTDNSSTNADDRILFDETFVDKIGLFNINTLGSGGQAVKVNTGGTGLEFGSAGGLVLLNTTDVTSDTATVTFDNTLITDTYSIYILEYEGLKPATDSVDIRSRYSSDNGSSFITGTFNYGYHYSQLGGAGTSGTGNTKSNYAVNDYTAGGASTAAANYCYAGTFHINGMRDSASFLSIRHEYIMKNASNLTYVSQEGWTLENASVINFMEWSFSSGNIADGTFSFYGLAK